MNKIIYIFILTLGVISCSSDDETRIDNSDLIGNWNWTNTDGGIGFHIHETPNSTGKIVELNIKDNNHYVIKENGNEVSNGTYEVIMKESIYSVEMERFIVYSAEYQNQNTIMSGIIRVLENNNLSIADNYVDGVESKYVKSN